MKIVFFGTPEYTLALLKGLHKKFVTGAGISSIVAVVTQPPQPTGRKQVLTYSAVDRWAHEHKVPTYYQASDLRRDKVEAEVAVLASYGSILKNEDLNYFAKGIINVHPSLLPSWRGASPVAASLIAGDNLTGGSVIKLDSQVDHGPILTQFKEEIKNTDTSETLRNRIFEKSAEIVVELLPAYLAGKVKLKAQDESLVTFTKRVTKEEGFIEAKYLTAAMLGKELKNTIKLPFMNNYLLPVTADNIDKLIRAMKPWPETHTVINSKRVKLLEAHMEDNRLILDKVQLEGKKPVNFTEFKRGYPELMFDKI